MTEEELRAIEARHGLAGPAHDRFGTATEDLRDLVAEVRRLQALVARVRCDSSAT